MNKISIDDQQGSYYHRKVLEDTQAIELLSRGPSRSKSLNYRPKVLVVDDEPAIRSIVKRTLEIQLYAEVMIAQNGEEASKLIEQNSFHLIISDMQMPIMTGLDLYRWIQINAPHLTEHFFIISGDLGSSAAADELHRYRIQVLKKPFLVATLVDYSLNYLPIQQTLESVAA